MNACGNRSSEFAGTRAERGVALLIVITILVTMVIVAVPFAMSMLQGRERTEAVAARNRASFEAKLAVDIAKMFLRRTHPDQEQQYYEKGQGVRRAEDDPTVDTLDEITLDDRWRKQLEEMVLAEWEKDDRMRDRGRALKARGLGPMNDDRGSIWTVLVQDAQALVNVNGASPFLLGNLLGGAQLTGELDTGGGDIDVENVTTGRIAGLPGFPADGGFIRIGREVIAYERFDGTTFEGCERGVLRSAPLGDNGPAQDHEKGSPVIDYTAYKLATHLIARNPGTLTPFRTLEELRDISSWGEGGVITAARLERLLPHITVWSRRETAESWLAPQLVTNELGADLEADAAEEVRVRDLVNPSGNTWYDNPGTIVRITDGKQTAYTVIQKVGDEKARLWKDMLTLAGPAAGPVDEAGLGTSFAGGRTTLSSLAPTPININTASREILYAVMANVQLYRAEGEEQVVTPDMAWDLAGRIELARKGDIRSNTETGVRQGGPFRHAEDWGRFLEELVDASVIKRIQQQALYLNSINPHCALLRFGTAPWCFRTLDVYHLESRVAINNRAGEQIADAALREVVEIGSDSVATWTLDSQADFEERLSMGSGAKWASTYPFAVAFKATGWEHIQPAPRGFRQFINGIYPSSARGEDLGDVRLEPARISLPGTTVAEHFDDSWYTDGHFTGYDGAYTRAVKGAFMGNGDQMVRPFAMSFWWRCYSNSDNWAVFDAGVEPFTNRFAVFADSGERGTELVFRCSAGNLEKEGAEVYVPLETLDYEPGNWYHVQVSCAGEDPSTMQMLVDGVDVGLRRGFTWLTSELASDNTEVQVDSSEGYPIRGAIRVGTEIIEYEQLTDDGFRECYRGARGTQANDWPSGTPVHNVGYSMPLTTDVRPGGAELREALRKWSAVRISSVESPPPDTVTVTIDGSDTPIVLGGYGSDRSTIQVQTVGMWGQNDEDGYEAFNSVGIALLGCPRIGNATGSGGEENLGGWEVCSYTRSSGSTFDIERYQETAYQGAADPYFLISYNVTGDMDFPCFLVPISILGQGGAQAESYFNPPNGTDEEILRRYYPNEGLDQWSPRLLLGTDTPEDEFEIIRYDSIDTQRAQGGILFVRDRNLSSVTNHFFGNSQQLTGGTAQPPPDTDPPQPPPDTDPPQPPPDTEPPGGGYEDPPGDGEDAPPTPGGSVPPGLRDPTDPPPPDDGGDDPSTLPDPPQDDPEPGVGDDPVTPPSTDPGTGGEYEDPDAEPTDPEFGDDPQQGDDPAAGGSSGGEYEDPDPKDGEGGSSGGGGPGGAGPGGDRPANTDGSPPPPEEPSEDSSGGGGEYENPEEGADDPNIPNQPAPGAREPADADPPQDQDPTSGVWEPEGPETARNLLRFRGVNGTTDREHNGTGSDRNSRLLPCFRVYEAFRAGIVQRCGRNDKVTISDGAEGTPVRMEIGIRWGDPSTDWVAPDDFVGQAFSCAEEGAMTRRADPRGYPRILKFPCGELPDEMSQDMEFAQSTLAGSGVVTAFLDELHIWRQGLDAPLVLVNAEGLREEEDEVRLASSLALPIGEPDGYDQDCGVLLLEGELIIYRGSRMEGDDVLVLEGCARGAFATQVRSHAWGAPARFLPDMPVSYLDAGMTAEAASLAMVRTRGWPREGLVRIVGPETAELVHYTRRTEQDLIMPESIDADERTRGRGLFRGRFGTTAMDHDGGELAIYQPFRFWDRYTPRRTEESEPFSGVHDHPDSSYLELGKRIRSAYWRGFTWSENVLGSLRGGAEDVDGSGDAAGFLDIVVLGRFSTHVPWDSKKVVDLRQDRSDGVTKDLTSKAADHLFVFDDVGSEAIERGVLGNLLNVESDTAEFRIYFMFKPNAFQPLDVGGGVDTGEDRVYVNNWKQTPWLRAFTATYVSRTATRYRAPVR